VFQVRLGDGEPADYREFLRLDQSAYPDLAADLVGRGIRILPRGTWFVSTAHTDADIDRTLDVLAAALHAAA
jgi:glutamate-1-semialdehyde 2,1-aminomutase